MVRHSGSYCHHCTLFRKIMSDTTTASSNKTPFSLINERRNKVKNTTDEDILTAFEQWLNAVAISSVHKPCCTKDCLRCLSDDDICQGIGKYLLYWGQKDANTRKQTISEWYRYAKTSYQPNAKQVYKLPYDAAGLGELATHKFAGRTLCLSALLQIFDLGQKKWEGIKKIVMSSGVSPVHKAKGKPGNRRFKEDNPLFFALQNHFLEWEDLDEPVATRIVCEVTGKVTEHDSKENTIYLPMCLQKRLLYRRFCKGQGWACHTTSRGSYKMKWVGEGPPQNNIVAWVTYRSFWECESPHLNVSKRHYHICNLCFAFANQHKYCYVPCFGDIDSLFSLSSTNPIIPIVGVGKTGTSTPFMEVWL